MGDRAVPHSHDSAKLLNLKRLLNFITTVHFRRKRTDMGANFAENNCLIPIIMNFTLTPGVYAALNLLSKSTRSKVLEAAFAFVICGIRPTNLSKNLLVMFMMVVDSASEGKLTYVPDEENAEENPSEETSAKKPAQTKEQEPEAIPTPEATPQPELARKAKLPHHTPGSTKVKGKHLRIRNRILVTKS